MYLSIIILIFLSFAITYFVTPKVIKFANKSGLVDNPKVRPHPAHIHQGIIPRAGGLGLLLGIINTILILPGCFHLDSLDYQYYWLVRWCRRSASGFRRYFGIYNRFIISPFCGTGP